MGEIEVNKYTIKLYRINKAVLFIIVSILLEIITYNCLFDIFIPKYFLIDFSFILLGSIIILNIRRNWLSNIAFYLFLLPIIIFGLLNGTIKNSTNDYFVFDMLSVCKDGMAAFSIYFLSWDLVFIYLLILILVIPFLFFNKSFFNKDVKWFKTKTILFKIFSISMCFCLFAVSLFSQIIYISYKNDSDEILSDYSLWTGETLSTRNSISTFGFYGFYLDNFYNTYLKCETYDENFLLQYIEKGDTQTNTDALLYNDNLIILCLESFDIFAIDPILTPNLWNLMNEGIYFSNFYGKNQTNVSEMISCLGYMVNNSILYADSDSYSVKYSLPNLFNELGYTTSYFHSYLKSFYDRYEVMSSIGFENTYFLDESTMENKKTEFSDWNLETDFFSEFINEIIPTDGTKFFSYYMTVGTHGGYSYRQNLEKYYQIYDENYDEFINWFENETDFIFPEDENLALSFKYFKSACMETDEMIGLLFNALNNTVVNGEKLIESTTILIFADHDCYYSSLSSYLKSGGVSLYNIPMIIYSKKLNMETEVDSFCSTYDIYPTICELFGLAYNKNYCIGENIFNSDFDSIFYSLKEGVGIFDGSYHLLYLSELENLNSDETEDEFMIKVSELLLKQKYLNQIYKSKLRC